MVDEESLIRLLLEQLSQTRYACADLTKLNGGTANFLYRGTLLEPFNPQDATAEKVTKTVVIKHSEGFSPGNRDFLLDVSRCVRIESTCPLGSKLSDPFYGLRKAFEESMLHQLAEFAPDSDPASAVVRSPRLYLFDRKTNTQVLEDCLNTTDLKTIFISPTVREILPGNSSASVGYNIGRWLRSFHQWTSEPGQAPLRASIGRNAEARKLKRKITYDSFVQVLETYPDIVEGHEAALETIKDAMVTDFELHKPPEGDDGNWGLIHGDFWTGNVLLPNVKWQEIQHPAQEPNRLFVIDWELAQFGHRAIDVGGMMADLYERKHFKGSDAVIPAMQGFALGYGRISDEMAYRTAIHAGVHLICWHIRGNPTLPLSAPMDRVKSALKIGRDLILKGWEKDRRWFESSVLAPLFTVS